MHAWLASHPNRHFYFVPTSSSWRNAGEGFFAKLARRCLKRGVFDSVAQVQEAILRFPEAHNRTEARPFRWRAEPEEIIASHRRGHMKLQSLA